MKKSKYFENVHHLWERWGGVTNDKDEKFFFVKSVKVVLGTDGPQHVAECLSYKARKTRSYRGQVCWLFKRIAQQTHLEIRTTACLHETVNMWSKLHNTEMYWDSLYCRDTLEERRKRFIQWNNPCTYLTYNNQLTTKTTDYQSTKWR